MDAQDAELQPNLQNSNDQYKNDGVEEPLGNAGGNATDQI